MLVADAHRLRLDAPDEVRDRLADVGPLAFVEVLERLLETRMDLDRLDARLLHHFAQRGLEVRLARLDVAFGEIPMAGRIVEKQVLTRRAGVDHDAGGMLVTHHGETLDGSRGKKVA